MRGLETISTARCNGRGTDSPLENLVIVHGHNLADSHPVTHSIFEMTSQIFTRGFPFASAYLAHGDNSFAYLYDDSRTFATITWLSNRDQRHILKIL